MEFNYKNNKFSKADIDTSCSFARITEEERFEFRLCDMNLNLTTEEYTLISDPLIIGDIGDQYISSSNLDFFISLTPMINEERLLDYQFHEISFNNTLDFKADGI